MTTLNISNQNIEGTCNLKCAYSFDYHNSSLVATNEGFSIKLTYDKANLPPAIYNTNKYEVDSVSIYCPSVHLFNGTQANAELIIEHRAVISGPTLSVGIPIIVSSDTNAASTLLTQIITSVSANAPAQGESTNLNINNFNLNTFIPVKKPIYAYTQKTTNWLIFGKESAISLNQTTIDTLAKIIKPMSGIQQPSGPLIFYNEKGAIKGFGGTDQIYIDCQPVTSSEEQIDVTTIKNANSFDLNNPTTIFILQIVVSCLLFFVLLFGVHYALKYMSNSSASKPKFGKVL